MKNIPAYSPAVIEPKWQKHWDDNQSFAAEASHDKPKFYGLIEFPYPSGAGLHVGHPRSNTAMDIIARKRRMEGYNVLFPIGWDAFGLPTENFAIKNNIHPAIVTKQNVDHFREQLKKLGFSFDYTREVDTTDPEYYKWTQWIFLKLFENGMVFRDKTLVNYCPHCKVVLSNEDSQGGKCDVCHGDVIQLPKDVWYLRITKYADRLLEGLKSVEYPENIAQQQVNWIGKSTGAFVDFKVTNTDETLQIYTTRPDTLFGVTFMVMAPEHPLIDKYADKIANMDAIIAYREECAKKTEFERTQLVKEKTGLRIEGLNGVNPLTGKEVPIFISDYVMMGYGTGAIMAVPAHDQRDWEFAKKFGVDIIEVIKGGDIEKEAYTGDGEMVNSDFLNGYTNKKDSIARVLEEIEAKGYGKAGVQYKMKDWAFNRQRYWGEPIPLIHCPHCGVVAVPYEELPLRLPEIDNFQPGTDGKSPLAHIESYVKCKCPKCGADAERETDTMPQWAGSSWYFLRYCDPHNADELGSKEALDYWMPVDWYNGGMEHVTRHLLYSRFWHQFLYDIGVVSCPEPYLKRTAQGLILGTDGEKMSKSRGNVVNPDDIIDDIGADAFRMYEMFMGAFDQAIPWSTDGARGCKRFLDRVWRLLEVMTDEDSVSDDMAFDVHTCIKKVSEDFEKMKFNTAIAAMMSLVNAFYAKGSITKGEMLILCKLLNPVAPHITEEINEMCKLSDAELIRSTWPVCDESKLVKSTVEVALQINGKVRGRMDIPADLTRDNAQEYFLAQDEVKKLIGDKSLKKLVFVPGRLVNLVVG
ncbi:MAG: leucine--tRNA ligase [Clostridiales bacterium]|nr:leucine--tRNA ligase [Clostridiales bacterium]